MTHIIALGTEGMQMSMSLVAEAAIQPVYLIFLDAYTSVSELGNDGASCSGFCGAHYYDSSTDFSYAVIVNPATEFGCLPGCTNFNNLAASPNGDVNVDSMINSAAHEIAELLSDPLSTGWYDPTTAYQPPGGEVGDKCDRQYGTTATVHIANGNSYQYNLQFDVNGRSGQYLVQQMWSNYQPGFAGGCGMGCIGDHADYLCYSNWYPGAH